MAVATDAPPSDVRRFFVTWVSSPGCSVTSAIAFSFLTTTTGRAAEDLTSASEDDDDSDEESESESSDASRSFELGTASADADNRVAPKSPATLWAGVESVRLVSRS